MPYTTGDYRILRAIEIARQLHRFRDTDFDLSGVEELIDHRFSSGNSNRNLTAHSLRNLQRLGYVIASNVFVVGDTNSQVRARFDDDGRNPLVNFVVAVKGEREIPNYRISWDDAISAIDIFDSHYTRRSTPEQRKEQILKYLTGRESATAKEISYEIGLRNVLEYLSQLETEGMIMRRTIKNRAHYSVQTVLQA